MKRALVFGGAGALGSAIVAELGAQDWEIEVAGRSLHGGVTVDVTADDWPTAIAAHGPFDGVVWAQGVNSVGGVLDVTSDDLHAVYGANVVFVAQTLRALVAAGALARPSRGVVLSSVWQLTARADKFSYVASKAALAGVIPAIAIDMAGHDFAINAVLPGVIDTPMTRGNLSAAQIARVEAAVQSEVYRRPNAGQGATP